MKKRILCAILSLAAVFSLMGFNATEAWFSGGENKSMVLNSGYFDYEAEGFAFEIAGEYLPGDVVDLASGENGITITNNSKIETELRIKIDCEYIKKDAEGNEVIEKAEYLTFSLPESEKYWKIVTEENITYLYYCPKGDASKEAPDYRIPATTEAKEITLNSNLIVSGEVPPEMIDKEMDFTVTIQAKQADIMKWSDFKPASENETTENTETTETPAE